MGQSPSAPILYISAFGLSHVVDIGKATFCQKILWHGRVVQNKRGGQHLMKTDVITDIDVICSVGATSSIVCALISKFRGGVHHLAVKPWISRPEVGSSRKKMLGFAKQFKGDRDAF